MNTITNKVAVNSPDEINADTIARIATLVHYGCDDSDITSRIPPTPSTPARWVTFMARTIRAGTYVP